GDRARRSSRRADEDAVAERGAGSVLRRAVHRARIMRDDVGAVPGRDRLHERLERGIIREGRFAQEYEERSLVPVAAQERWDRLEGACRDHRARVVRNLDAVDDWKPL